MPTYYGTSVYATGGTGPYRNQLPWFEFNIGPRGTNIPLNTTLTFVNTIPKIGIATLDFRASLSGSGMNYTANSWNFGPLYSGVQKDATNITLLFTGSAQGTSLNSVTSNIRLVDFNNNPITDFYFVISNSEDSGGTSEFNQYVTTGGPWKPVYSAGNVTGWGTQTLRDSGSGAIPVAGSYQAQTVTWTATMSVTTGIIFSFLLPEPTIVKYVDKAYEEVNNTLTYTVIISNNDIVSTLSNITFVDTIPTYTTLIANTVNVNGVSTSFTETNSITIPDIGAGKVATVQYKVLVSTLPTSSIIQNDADVYCLYGTIPFEATSNLVTTTVPVLNIDLKKYANTTSLIIPETVLYTLIVANKGNIDIANAIIVDTLPNGLSYVAASIIGGAGIAPTSIALTTITAGSVKTVTFQARLTTIPSPNPTLNDAILQYIYKPDPTLSTYTRKVTQSNVATVSYSSVNINQIKVSDKNYAIIGDTITYTIIISNSGVTVGTNILMYDTLPNALTFIPNSLTLNGVSSQYVLTQNTIQVTIPDIAPLNIVTVTFNALVTTLPSGSNITNNSYVSFTNPVTGITSDTISTSATTTISMPILISTKYSDKIVSYNGDTITYTIVIQNLGNRAASNVTFKDTIPSGVQVVSGSFKQDGTNIVSNGIPEINVTLPNSIGATEVSTVSYKLLILGNVTPNPIMNTASINTTYIVDQTTTPNRVVNSSTNTNTVSNVVYNADLSSMIKTVDKGYATCGDLLEYNIILNNTGNSTAINIVFKDTIPNGLSFVANSLSIDGLTQFGANPENGVLIPNIIPNQRTTITFKVKVEC